MSKDPIGDRIKIKESQGVIPDEAYILARLDGRGFSKWTRGLATPFDPRLHKIFDLLTERVARHTGAQLGYTQSDEISLYWTTDRAFFEGKSQKIASVCAAYTSVQFNQLASTHGLADRLAASPHFDCRVWSVPTFSDVGEVFTWRFNDAVRNSAHRQAREYYSHHELHRVSTRKIQRMLAERNIVWDDRFRFGLFVRPVTVTGPIQDYELDQLPEKHHMRTNPSMEVTRTHWSPEIVDLRSVNFTSYFGATPRTQAVGGKSHSSTLVDALHSS